MKKVVIYTGPICNFCSAAKHLLNKKKVNYEEIDIGYDEIKREELFNKLVDQLYEKGKAIEAAAHLEIDAVIDPVETRSVILKASR